MYRTININTYVRIHIKCKMWIHICKPAASAHASDDRWPYSQRSEARGNFAAHH